MWAHSPSPNRWRHPESTLFIFTKTNKLGADGGEERGSERTKQRWTNTEREEEEGGVCGTKLKKEGKKGERESKLRKAEMTLKT